MNTTKILEKIKKKRQQLNYSQEYMATALQMKQANYNKIENGKVILTAPLLFRIWIILELNGEELLNEVKNSNEN